MLRLIIPATAAVLLFLGSPPSAQDAPSPPAVTPPPSVSPPQAGTPSQHSPAAPQPPAAAASPPMPESDTRFSVHRVQDALIRLDGRTGQVSVCSQGAAGWACQAVPDDRVALENEIGRLQGENVALKRELLARNLPLPNGAQPPAPLANAEPGKPVPGKPPIATPETRLPTEAELDRALAFLTKAWRRMVEMMAEVQRDIDRKNSGRN